VSLSVARELISEGNHAYAQIERQALEFLRQEGFQPEYFNVCRASDLQKATAEDIDLVILTAAKLGKTRLIDNIHFNIQSSAIANESMW
jgi:pantoate--beta-alanine ligase